jgi:hypothetical protein
LQVTRKPGYLGFVFPGVEAAPDGGMAELDADSVFPAAELLMGEELRCA